MIAFAFLDYFTDPVLRAPMLGAILMSLSASLVGVLVFLRKESLIGEALSHAAYPGVIFGVFFCGVLFGDAGEQFYVPLLLMTGAFLTAMLGLKTIHFLEARFKVKQDAALCYVLSFFFGVGILAASRLQFSYSNLYRQVQIYFYGQAATMTDIHVALFALLALLVIFSLYLLRKEFELFLFDRHFASANGVPQESMERVLFILTGLSIVIGIRSVGVIMMSAMLIAPAVAARQFASSFRSMCLYASLFGVLSAISGTYLSNEISIALKTLYPGTRISLPTGPLIVLAASALCFFALLFSPKRGALVRWFRLARFRNICLQENILKAMWRYGERRPADREHLQGLFNVQNWRLARKLKQMERQGWVESCKGGAYLLTPDGAHRARKIVRLHRLWEVYLADYVGIGKERVHASAEEMEHVLTPELEHELRALLHEPKFDPHHQPIPVEEV